LRESLRRHAELGQERRFFVGAIAHDLRTPLFSLRGYLEGLGKGITNTPEKTARYVAVCQQKADDLEHLVSDLFAYSQLDYVDRAPECEIVDVHVLLREAVEGARPQAEEKGVALLLEEPDEASAVMASSHLLARAVGNLLDNALRHTPMGGSVRVALRRKGEDWVFTVADTGPGIAPHDLPHIFDPLYRGEASRSRRTGGVGLGLAIARRALRAYDGELTATNGPAGGALFTGTLPGISPTITRARHDIRDMRFEADGADTITHAAPHTGKETL
jgi:signal transduction histidine kinase